nr:MAG TPA: major capsid protein [Caudoviricetes sp.]
MKKLLELRQQKAALKTQMRSMLDKADSEKRSLNDEEGKQFDELRAQADALEVEITRLEAVADDQRNLPGTPVEGKGVSNDELRHYIMTGDTRSLTTLVQADGGYTVIPELDKEIMRQLQDDSVMRSISTVKTTKTNEYQKLVSVGGATVNRGTEGETRTETSTPKMERVDIKLNPIYAYPKTTQEILDFSEVDILGWLASEISDTFSATEENDFVNGDGTKKSKGFLAYTRLLKQQREQISLAGQNNELAKMKYQVVQGELASLDNAKKAILLQNAALIDQKNIEEKLQAFRNGLADSNAAARDRGNIDFLGAGMGNKARDRMKEMADIRADFRKRQDELDRDFSSKQLSKDLYEQQTEALKAALAERLAIQDDYQKQSDAQQSDWRAGISDSLMNYADQAKDLSSMSATATSEILNNATNSISTNMTNVLTGATSFKDGMSNIFTSLGESVIQSLIQMATQALITKAILASVGGGAGGMFGSLFGGASGAASSGTAIQSAGANFSFNALGGVYDSPSLSAYSGGVYSTPQYFAFAKGAGVFGEAGPEAIMPLTRGADGSLGVRAIGRQSPAVQDAARQIEAQPRIAISISAPNTFTGKPDDATLLAFDQRNAALKRQLINELTAEVHNPQKQFGRAIYSNLQPKKPR